MFDHEQLKVYFRGEFVEFKDATVSIANTGFMYGLGVFSGIRAHYNSARKKLYIFRPEDHYRRFSFACKLCRYELFLQQYDFPRFVGVLCELLRVNRIEEDAYIRVAAYTDETKITPKFRGYRDAFCAFLYAIGDYVPISGMKCQVSSWHRVEDNALPARAKIHGAYANTAFARAEAEANGYEEAIFLDSRGHVVEGSAENIFLILDGTLVTPAVHDNTLEGVTRKSVIEIATDLGYTVAERSVDRTELYRAEEVFFTGTGAQVSPVIQIDGYSVGDGTVGPVAKQIQRAYFDAVRGEAERYQKWVVAV